MKNCNWIKLILIHFILCQIIYAGPEQKKSSKFNISKGRYVQEKFKDENKTFTFTLNWGLINEFEGRVVETNRASRDYDEKRDEYEKYLEDYTFDDLGFEDTYPIYGIQFEKRWRFLTLLFDMGYFNFETSAVAENEPYAIGLKEVAFEGEEYNYMLIPEGQEFDTEIKGGILGLNAKITPCHFTVNESFHISPWFFLGIYSISGKFNIDAGEPKGITTYEYHPYPYVIGGQGEGWFGAGFPEMGYGAEFSLNLLNTINHDLNLVFQFNLVEVDWKGSTDDFGLNVRHEKDIELDYKNSEFRIYVELPLFKSADVLIGCKYQNMTADIIAKAKDRNEEDIELLKEKYDKTIELDVSTFTGMISIRY